jgi:hypothetical protein
MITIKLGAFRGWLWADRLKEVDSRRLAKDIVAIEHCRALMRIQNGK